MRDRTAQTEPLTAGQQIVAAWETDIIAEPCELAECIDNRIAAAVKVERERCAAIVKKHQVFYASDACGWALDWINDGLPVDADRKL